MGSNEHVPTAISIIISIATTIIIAKQQQYQW